MSSSKKRILIFIDWFYPAYKAGGPVKSIYHITENLANECDFFIVCSNQDLDGSRLDVLQNQWISKEHSEVMYLDQTHQNRKVFQKLYEEVNPQVIYYNNMFSFSFGIKPLWHFRKLKGVKQLLAPRGMLGEGALQLKAKKKKLFLRFAKKFLFRKSLNWHASTKQEAKEIKKVIGLSTKVQIAQNLSSKPQLRKAESIRKQAGELRLVFISRLSEKKNLYFLLELITNCDKLSQLRLDIYGPIDQGEYWNRCQSLIEDNHRIRYCGTLKPTEINQTLLNYHFFILPTLHENYGHAIAEAINIGVPVMISKRTPWSMLVSEGIGYDIELSDKNAWQLALKEAYALPEKDYLEMCKACYAYAQRNIVNSRILKANRKLFTLEGKD